jgi:hypothetical protein
METITAIDLLYIAIGYAYSIFAGVIFVRCFSRLAYEKIGEYNPKDSLKSFRWTANLVGILERIIYTSSIIFGVQSFIPIWLGVKIISQWKKGEIENGRAMFNIYLIGTGLSLAYGSAGGQIILWLRNDKVFEAVIAGVALIVLNLLMIWYTNHQEPYSKTSVLHKRVKIYKTK